MNDGYLWAMIVMMVAPYLVVAVIGGGLFRAHRKARRDAVERFLKEESELPPEGEGAT